MGLTKLWHPETASGYCSIPYSRLCPRAISSASITGPAQCKAAPGLQTRETSLKVKLVFLPLLHALDQILQVVRIFMHNRGLLSARFRSEMGTVVAGLDVHALFPFDCVQIYLRRGPIGALPPNPLGHAVGGRGDAG